MKAHAKVINMNELSQLQEAFERDPLPNVADFLTTLFHALHRDELFPYGLVMVLILLLTFHGMFVLMLTVMFHRVVSKYVKPGSIFLAGLLYFVVINVIFFSHIVDILVWAYVTVCIQAIEGPLNAFYFAGEMYTTLGYGNFVVNPAWRTLPVLIAICGIFSSAISGAALYSMLSTFLVSQKLKESLRDIKPQSINPPKDHPTNTQ